MRWLGAAIFWAHVVTALGWRFNAAGMTHAGLFVKTRAQAQRSISDAYNLPKLLRKTVEDLHSIDDDKLRYQQLMFFASTAKRFDEKHKIEANKVPGCLSTVYIHACARKPNKIQFLVDSDSLLTKGLAAFLAAGLSGSTADEIERIDPAFVVYARLGASLTPGRTNGFLNMLNMMKVRARELAQSTGSATTLVSASRIPRIQSKLAALQPMQKLRIEDQSQAHVGHAHSPTHSNGEETHLALSIVSSAFEGLSLVRRHQMVYALLDDELQGGGLHALTIDARTPAEFEGEVND